MAKRSQEKKAMKDVAIFLLKVNLLLMPFYAIVYLDISFYPLQILFADMIAFILRLFGYSVSTSGFFLFAGEIGIPIDMSRDCIGWKSAYSLFALALATPGKMKGKLKFLCVGVPLLLAINVFRVVSILLIGLTLGVKYLEIIHTFFWQVMMIFIVLIVWLYWLRNLNFHRHHAEERIHNNSSHQTTHT